MNLVTSVKNFPRNYPLLVKLVGYTIFLLTILLIVSIFSLSRGEYIFSVTKVFSILFSSEGNEIERTILLELRLPRTLTAITVGASLSLVGTVFQALLKNPLAEPYILGISSGGALGAVFAISIGVATFSISAFSFTGSFIAFIIVYLFGRRFGEIDPTSILLIGVMVNAFASALILLIITFVDQSFRIALFWLMGSLSMVTMNKSIFMFTVFFITSLIFIYLSHQYNLISISEENAKQYGVNIQFLKNLSFVLGSFIIGVIVAFVGIIGFVGLVVPHICRLIFGFDNRFVIPLSVFVGGIFMVLADLVSRTAFSPMELPIGIITAIIGAPIFIFLLRQRNYKYNGG